MKWGKLLRRQPARNWMACKPDIVRMIDAGMNNEQIAKHYGVSREYLRIVREQLGIISATEALRRRRLNARARQLTVYIPGRKTCPRCNENKPLADFPLCPSGTHGRGCHCKTCVAARNREYYRTERGKAAHKRWADANPEKVAAASKRYREKRKQL